MAQIKVEGMEEWIQCLVITEAQTANLCGRSVYPGAKIVAGECKNRLQSLVTDDSLFRFSAMYGKLRKGPTTKQKQALIDSMGIAQMKYHNGAYDVKLGFDGYNGIVSERWPKGQPNAMIARSVNGGTSFMRSQPFMDQTVNATKEKKKKAIAEQFDKELEKFWSKKSPQFVTKDSVWK